MALYDAKITWTTPDNPNTIPYFSEGQVSAKDQANAKEIIKAEFSKQLRGFSETPEVIFKKIELNLAQSNFTIVSGYGS